MNGDTTENPDQADDPVQATGSNGSLNLQQQMLAMQKLMDTQLQLMQMQMNHRNITNQEANSRAVSTVKRATIPSGRYDMNSHEFRTYAKDCTDFKKLTGCTEVTMRVRKQKTTKTFRHFLAFLIPVLHKSDPKIRATIIESKAS